MCVRVSLLICGAINGLNVRNIIEDIVIIYRFDCQKPIPRDVVERRVYEQPSDTLSTRF